jgi:four helix bundle protein
MGKDAGFESLEAWKVAREFRKEVSVIVKTFPKYEQYQLSQQITNSSRSVSANISEGYGRFHYKETTKHCRIARGSLDETLDHLICACDESYIDDSKLQQMREQHERCRKLINGYIRYIEGLDGNGKKK